MSDVRAAAERALAIAEDRCVTLPSGPYEFENAVCVVCESYLSEHPADDAEPITEEWLRTLGGKEGTAPADDSLHFWDFVYDEFVVSDDGCQFRIIFRVHSPGDDGCITELHSEPDGGGVGLTKHWCKTRGDLRLLCRALGIELQEQPNA